MGLETLAREKGKISVAACLLTLALISGLAGTAYAHTVDSVGQYRLEIGWMNEPVTTDEINAIEIYASPLEDGLELEEQEFKNGIGGLEKTLKIDLVYRDKKITLPLIPDHDIPGKYYGFVVPTVPGYYQANILGTISDTNISLSMHPPKVDDRMYVEFPEREDMTLTQLIDGHTALIEDVKNLSVSIDGLMQPESDTDGIVILGYAGIGLGVTGIAVAIIAIARTRK